MQLEMASVHIKKKSGFCLSAAFMMIIILLTGCGTDISRNNENNEIRNGGCITRTGFYFDTVISISIYSDNDERLLDDCMALCSRYENVFSPTSPESELYHLNRLLEDPDNAGSFLEISMELYDVIGYVLPFCEKTGGKYDLTIRPVSELWDFKSENPLPPPSELITEKLKLVDYKDISLFSEDSLGNMRFYLKAERSGISLDLGSVAKGYVADRLDGYLREKGVTSAVISLGGNIQCIGEKPLENGEREPFNIGISSPFADDGSIYRTVEGSDNAIVTSGTDMRSFEYEGLLYHHILNADTGYPENNGLVSVTIVADSGLKADMLSTVCFLSGYDEAVVLLSEFENIYAEFVYNDNSIKSIGRLDNIGK